MAVDLNANRDLLLGNERQIARSVAGDVVDKPILAMWMVLIPIFFVFYFFQLKRYKNGLREFSHNFLITRQRTIEKVCEAGQSGSDINIEGIIDIADIPAEAVSYYRTWVELLAEHYRLLIKQEGLDYDDLVKAVYPKKSSYLAVLNKMNRVEADFNEILAAHLPGDRESIDSVIASMEKSVAQHRRSKAAEIYS